MDKINISLINWAKQTTLPKVDWLQPTHVMPEDNKKDWLIKKFFLSSWLSSSGNMSLLIPPDSTASGNLYHYSIKLLDFEFGLKFYCELFWVCSLMNWGIESPQPSNLQKPNSYLKIHIFLVCFSEEPRLINISSKSANLYIITQ